MISEIQAEANQANAEHSTGPRTEEGKARSSQNAIKHGAFAKSIVLSGESQEEFDAMHDGFIKDHNPEGETERGLVRGLTETQWRLNRLRCCEAAAMDQALESGDFESKSLLNYTLIEQRLVRTFQTTLKLLKDTQAPRLARREQDLRIACELRQLSLINNLPWQPEQDGFVFSLQEINDRIALQARLEMAAQTIKYRFHPDLGVKRPSKKAA
jgi:hypothetical protein